MRFIIPFGLTLLFTGCAATTSANYYNQTVQSWHGGNVKNLVEIWGTPDQKVSTLAGTTVYVYKSHSFRSAPASESPSIGVNTSRPGSPTITVSPNTNQSWSRSTSTTCLAAFEFDSKGKIIDTKTQGSGCYGGHAFMEQKANSPR